MTLGVNRSVSGGQCAPRMPYHTSIHYQTQPAGNAGQAPDWIHLLPAGEFFGVDGRGPFRVLDMAALITASMANGKLCLDECHATDTAARMGQPAPARGWIITLDPRADGLWGQVDWTPPGKELMAAQAYRGISPVFDRDAKGNVLRLLRASLTNDPNLTLAALHHQENSVDLTLALRKALGLPETADNAAIVAAVTAQHTAVSMHGAMRKVLGLPDTADAAAMLSALNTQTATVTAHATQIRQIAEAAGAKATDASGLVTELQAVRTNAGSVETMAGKIVSLETELGTIRTAGARSAAETFVDGAIREGKPVMALRDHYVSRHMKDRDGVEKEIGAMISIHAAGGSPPWLERNSGDADVDALSTEEMSVARKMGVDPKEFAKTKKADEARRMGGR
jgi:phage I-like protein